MHTTMVSDVCLFQKNRTRWWDIFDNLSVKWVNKRSNKPHDGLVQSLRKVTYDQADQPCFETIISPM